MSIFKKLKDKLFKTTSKLSDGIDSIMDQPSEEIEVTGEIDQNRNRAENYSKEKIIISTLKEKENSNKKSGILRRVMSHVDLIRPKRKVDDKLIEKLEDLLISADMGVETATKIVRAVSKKKFNDNVDVDELKGIICEEIVNILAPVSSPLEIFESQLQIILVVGVNGSGKTTTIGKLASQYKKNGKKVMIAAGDTFRAAAIEQLSVWGDRAQVPVIKSEIGSDPASLAFEAINEAQKQAIDILFIDTAGRLQNRSDLMEELGKVVRVIGKKQPDAPHNSLLVLDATVGQNALSQVEVFSKIANISGLIMTKLDGTAKGGVLVSLAQKFKIPIHAIGFGEGIEDLQPFDPNDYAKAIIGLEIKK